MFLRYYLMKRWICYLGITYTQYLTPINSWHSIPELDYISMAHVTPKRRFRITQGAFAYITCNMEHNKMIWYTGTWYSLYMVWVSFKIVSKYMIYKCSSVFSYSRGLGYQREHTVWGYSAVRLEWHGSVRQHEHRCRTPRTSGSVVPIRQHE